MFSSKITPAMEDLIKYRLVEYYPFFIRKEEDFDFPTYKNRIYELARYMDEQSEDLKFKNFEETTDTMLLFKSYFLFVYLSSKQSKSFFLQQREIDNCT